jgi:hypothetical protein
VPDAAALPLLLLPLPKRGLYGKLPPALDARLRGTVVRLVSVFDSEDSCTHKGTNTGTLRRQSDKHAGCRNGRRLLVQMSDLLWSVYQVVQQANQHV